jgi:type I restriction enzyme S subunit
MIDPTEKKYRELLHYGPDRIEKHTGELLPALTAEEDGLISGKFLCTAGEILYSKIRPYLNKVALVKQPCLCSADIYPVTASAEFLTKEYLWVLLRSKAFLDYVAGFSRRANIPKLNRKQFAGYFAPTPPLDLQNRFAIFVESIEQQKTRLRAHLAELDTLFASLQTRAFNGEL